MRVIINLTTLIPRIILGLVFLIILIGVIAYARGYRLNIQDGTVTSTGIISVNSSPRAAKVYVNGQLKGATDINLTLPYGKYTIEVKKEGYTDWKKTIALKGETVMSLDAHLYSKNPSLTPLTNLGIIRAIPVGNTDRIILVSQTGDIEKDGLYMFESNQRPISIFPPLNPIVLKANLPDGLDLRTVELDFDPNYQQAIASFTYNDLPLSYLVSLNQENIQPLVLESKENVISVWNEEKNNDMVKIIETLPKKIRPIAFEAFEVVSLSPDEKRLMYLAKKDVTLPLVITPPLIGANQSQEERTIKRGSVYIYDKKEDKNFRIPVEFDSNLLSLIPSPTEIPVDPTATDSATPVVHVSDDRITRAIQSRLLWYPTSDYIAVKERNQIVVMQYDGDNKQTVYAGPFSPDFFSISPDWNVMVIINLNPNNNQYGDLYSVGVR